MKNITKIIAIILIVGVCTMVVQSHPTEASEQDQIDAIVILPDGIPTEFFLPQIKVDVEPEPIPEVIVKLNYKDPKPAPTEDVGINQKVYK